MLAPVPIRHRGMPRAELDALRAALLRAQEDGDVRRPEPGEVWDAATGGWSWDDPDAGLPAPILAARAVRELGAALQRAGMRLRPRASPAVATVVRGAPAAPPAQGALFAPLTGEAWRGRSATRKSFHALQEAVAALARGIRSQASGGGNPPPYVQTGPSNGKGRKHAEKPAALTDTDGPAWPLPVAPRNCTTGRWHYLACSRSACGAQSSQWAGCGTRRCQHCTGWHARKRSRSAWGRVFGGARARMGVVTFTLPPELRHHAADAREAKRWTAAAWRAASSWLSSTLGALPGGVVALHPTGSVDVCTQCGTRTRREGPQDEGHRLCCNRAMVTQDDSRWHPHWNVLVTLQRADGRVCRYHASREQLDELRAAWAREVEALTGESCAPVVWYGYRGTDDAWQPHGHARGCPCARCKSHIAHRIAVRHSLRYFLRPFPTWAHYCRRIDWFGCWSTRNGGARRDELRAVDAWRPAVTEPCTSCGMGRLVHLTTSDPCCWSGHAPPPPTRSTSPRGPPHA